MNTSDDQLRVSLLGPVRAWRAGRELALGSAHRRAVLAVLASRANQVVTRSELIDAVWGEAAPASANGSIYTYVSALRSVLEPEKPKRADWQVLVSAGSGYCLRLGEGALDLERFDQLREQAKERPDTAALDAALELWQGEAFDGIPGPYAEAQRARLADLRLSTVERRAQLLINAGRQHGVVDELRDLCDRHPLREGLHGLLMHALYLAGRRAEAISVFQRIRSAAVDSLGTEPGPQLTGLFDEILRDAPTLRRTIPLAATARPEPPRVMVGRDDEVAMLRAAVSAVAGGTGGVFWIDGEQGIGKSAVLAAGLAETGGCQLAWHTADEPATPLRSVLDCLDVTTESPDPRRAALAAAPGIDGVVDLVTELCANEPLIMVFDQVRWTDLTVWHRLAEVSARLPLLLVAASRTAPEKATLTLDPLPDDAVRLLVTALTGGAPDEALLDLARGAAGNPLYVRELLAHGEVDPAERLPRPVVSAITRHVTHLSDPARGLLRWAALCGDVFTIEDLGAVLPAAGLPDVLAEVVDAGLLTEVHGQLSFRHPLVRRALRDKHPTGVRAALHRQLAEALAAAGAPVERVAEQLVPASGVVDPWLCDWLAAEIGVLAPRSPITALRLLRRVLDADGVSSERKEALATTAARLMAWLDHAPRAEASYVAKRTADRELAAEMRWLLAYLQFRRGDTSGAVEEVDQVLRDQAVSESWRRRHGQLLATFGPSRVRAAAGGSVLAETVSWARKAFRPLRTAATPQARPPDPEEDANRAIGSYWQGRWDDALTAIAAPVSDGSALAAYALGSPSSARLTHGVAALIAGHRGAVAEAQAHLAAAASTAGMDHEGVVLAATALLAEQRGDTATACDVLTTMIEPGSGAPGFHWLPWLVRLAMTLGRRDRAEDATTWCAQTARQDPVSTHCWALLDRDPESALKAAEGYRRTGRRLAYARAMADAAALLAEQGRVAEAAEAVRAPVRIYTELGAGWDLRRMYRP